MNFVFKKLIILFLILLTTSCTEFLQSFDEEKIKETLNIKHKNVINILGDDSIPDVIKRLKLNNELVPLIDFEYIAHDIIGAKFNRISSEQKRVIPNLLRQIIPFDLWSDLKDYNIQVVEISKIEFFGGDLSSLSLNVKKEEQKISSLEVKLKKSSGTWMIYDLHANGESWLENYKKEYRKILKRKSTNGLVKYLERKVRKIK